MEELIPKAYRVLIVDEQQNARLLLRRMLERLFPDGIIIIAEAGSVAEAVEKIHSNSPHIVLLDILLPDGTGFDVIDAFEPPNFGVVFITGFTEYAIRAIRYGAIDYLMKPIALNELSDAMHRALVYLRFLGEAVPELVTQRLMNPVALQQTLLQANDRKTVEGKISLPTTKGSRIIATEEIVYCEAQSNYTRFYFSDTSTMMIPKTMGYFEPTLANHGFARIHRSFIINPHHVRETIRNNKTLTVMMTNQTELPVSPTYQEELQRCLPL